MILGIGTDLANIDRIAGTLERFGDRFRNRVFTETEQRKAEARVEHALAAAVAERHRRDSWRPPLDEVEVSAVRLSPDFREATVTWRLAESLRPPRSRFFADAAPPASNPDLTEAAEAALARVAGGLRAEVARRARLRFAPALVFHHDARRSAEGFAPEHLAGLVVGEGLGPR